jgi:hypothetical protein
MAARLGERALEPLIQALDDSDPRTCARASEALGILTGKPFLPGPDGSKHAMLWLEKRRRGEKG